MVTCLSNDYSIIVQKVSKNFKVYPDKGYTLKERFLQFNRNRYAEHQVLKNISFCVKRGEAVGLIGENGAGKSTMLKLLSKIIYPDSGTIQIKGRVACLIELGAGFHPDMTGRENIYVNAAIFGLNKREINDRIDNIIRFSELEESIDNPVRTYSSGMYMRLAFSIAINVDADILLIDEILAVGDAAFQSKCFNKLHDLKNTGTTIVLVSHSLSQIEAICDRCIWFKDGIIEKHGLPMEVNAYYMDYMVRKQLNENTNTNIETIVDESLKLNAKSNNVCLKVNDSLTVQLVYSTKKNNIDVDIRFVLYRSDGMFCCGINIPESIKERTLKQRKNRIIKFIIEKLVLLPGEYFIDIYYYDSNRVLLQYSRKAAVIIVVSDEKRCDDGIVALSIQWKE